MGREQLFETREKDHGRFEIRRYYQSAELDWFADPAQVGGFGKGWIGRLPGDLYWSKGNFAVFFPIVTCVLLSIIFTIVISLLRK